MKENPNCIFSFIRRKFDFRVIFGCLLGVIVAVTALGINIEKNIVYKVNIGNKNIGYVKEIEAYTAALDAIRETDGSEPLQSITADKSLDRVKKYLSTSEIEKIARQELNLKMPAVALYVNGTELAKLQDEKAVENVLEQVKKYYYPQEEDFKVVSSNIKEKITTSNVMIYPDEVQNVDSTVEKILNGQGIKKTYTVKKGDTIWGIALKNNLSIEEIQAANQGMNIDKLKLDQVINLSLSQPYLNVEVIADVSSEEPIPYDSKDVTDSKLNKGVKKVKQAGQNGLAQVEARITMLNGDVISEDVTKNTVIKQPVNEIVAVGSKVVQYVASGGYIRPARGIITSRYGTRHREFHTGVDFAAPRGTQIVAANSGKVSFVGWNGGYGLCVMINHGNGIQTLYGHTSKVYVKVGQSVKKGQKIAAIGSTGRSTGPHVHFEVRKNGKTQNPMSYLN